MDSRPPCILFGMLAMGLATLITQVVPATGTQARPQEVDRRTEWLKAVAAHVPGTLDEAAQNVGTWSERDVRATTGSLRELRSEPNPNALLKRAALLHTDIAIHVEPFVKGSDRSARQNIILTIDGRFDRYSTLGVHWETARRLLEPVDPAPSRDQWVRLWYRSTALYLASQRHLAALRAHLNAARFVFPSDPVIAFISGCLHEALSAPELQMAGQYYARAGGRGGTVDSAEKNLDEATTYFRRAVEFDPDFVEARIHLGRVLRLRSHHDQSANELRRAIASVEDPLLAYFGHLFLADTEQARGHDDVARESALRAAGLFPRAQSPHLALAYLARRRGDREAAERALEVVLSLSERGDDPWWDYNVSHARDAKALLAETYKPFLDGGPQ